MFLKIHMFGVLLLNNNRKIELISLKVTKYRQNNVQSISHSLKMVRYVQHVHRVNFLTSEQNLAQTVKINKNISLSLMNANNSTKNLTTMQVRIGSQKTVIVSLLTTN